MVRRLSLMVLMLLAVPLFSLLGGTPAGAVATLCMPQPDVASCISSTMGNRADPLKGVDVTVSGPGGFEETVTTEEDGKWSFRVTETGEYTIALDPKTLPKDFEAQKNSTSITIDQLGTTVSPILQVRPTDYDASGSYVDYLLESSINGLRLGLLLALASIGLSLIYGTTGLSSFSHAEQVALGGMLGFVLVNQNGLNLWLGGALVVLICGFTGWFQDRVMWTPLRRRGLGIVQMMIVTIGLSMAMQYFFQVWVGPRTVRVLTSTPERLQMGAVSITYQSLAGMGIAVVVIAAVGFALLRTRIGQATRAVSDNPALAAASGIDVDRVVRLVWTVACALAGLSGLLYALAVNGIKWDSGLQILLLLFASVTLGGLGTAFGALVGALIIGMLVELSPALGMPGDFKYATALMILILLLVVRPQGLLGKAQRVG